MTQTLTRRQFGMVLSAGVVSLALVRAGLADQALRIDGDLVYRERMALPKGSEVEILVQDVSRADAPARVLGRYHAVAQGGSPIPFSMRIDPALIPPNATVALQASISFDGQKLFISTDHIPLPTKSGPKLTIPLQRAAKEMPPPATGPQGSWLVEDIFGKGVPDGPQANLTIGPDGRVSGTGGCNRISGHAEYDAEKVTFSKMASTMMACIGAGMELEARFNKALGDVARYRVDAAQSKLFLMDAKGIDLMRLSRLDP